MKGKFAWALIAVMLASGALWVRAQDAGTTTTSGDDSGVAATPSTTPGMHHGKGGHHHHHMETPTETPAS